jgi:hypothetical protein
MAAAVMAWGFVSVNVLGWGGGVARGWCGLKIGVWSRRWG